LGCTLTSTGSYYRSVVGSYEDGNKRLTSIKGGEYVDKLREYQLLEKDS